MDELKGPTIQIVLHVKEGLGFGFLKSPFLVSGSLNGYVLETDPIIPCHAPFFDAELVWEADKRRFRNLRVQNVPVKVEVYATGTQGRKDKVGYLLLSLLAAQPCPNNRYVDVKYAWHRLLGVKSSGKCCQPQLMLSLSIQDRMSTPTPRNELRMFHSNEEAFPMSLGVKTPLAQVLFTTVNEYIEESKRTVSSPDLQPRLLCDEGLIQIGDGNQHFVLSFVIGTAENIDVLLPKADQTKEVSDCYITYSVFTHNIMTDRVPCPPLPPVRAAFNQRTSLRVRTSLRALGRYLRHCPHVVARLAGDRDVGICSIDLRKLVPTDDLDHFLNSFCNGQDSLTIGERCYMIGFDETSISEDGRRAFVDVEMTLKYVASAPNDAVPRPTLCARSACTLSARGESGGAAGEGLTRAHSQCHIALGDVRAYTNITDENTTRYRTATGDATIQTNEIADMIKKMCESFAQSQEKLLASKFRPTTSDMQIQCETEHADGKGQEITEAKGEKEMDSVDSGPEKSDAKRETNTAQETKELKEHFSADKDFVKAVIPPAERDAIMQRFVDELEDWKEKQQELYKCQLTRKEEYHLELLSREWAKKRVELETKLSKGIEQCRNLAGDLSRATEDFKLRGYRNTEREKKLLEAKKALEGHYTAKFQELRDASQVMEDDMRRQMRDKDLAIRDLELNVLKLEKQIDVLKNNLKNNEKEIESKYSGLTKDQTASLIQELRCLEEKLSVALQGKSFFKEQWARAVRELHRVARDVRGGRLREIRGRRREIGGAEPFSDQDILKEDPENEPMKDDFYVDMLANMPAVDCQSIMSNQTVLDGLDMFNDLKEGPKNPLNEKLNGLIAQRDELVKEENPDEALLKQLNQDIRNILLNYGT